MEPLVIVGAGGFGRELAWLAGRINRAAPAYRLLGFCDDAPGLRAGERGGLPLLGPVEQAPPGSSFFCAIGDNRARRAATARALARGLRPATLVDPSAVIAPGVRIGAGSVVGIGAVVSIGCRVGRGVIINHRVCVGHDVAIGDYAQLCPGVCVSGGCSVGEGALLGTLAGAIPLKRIGAWATVGAGAFALRDIEDGGGVVRLR